MSEEPALRRDTPYDAESRKQNYRDAGVSEEDIELVFTPIARYIKDPAMSARARAAHDKYTNYVYAEKAKAKKEEEEARRKRFESKEDETEKPSKAKKSTG